MAHSSSLFTTYRIYDGQNGSECYFSEPQWLYKVCTISVSPSLPPSPSSSLHLTSLISVWRETWLQRGSHPPPWTLHPSVYLSVCLSVCLSPLLSLLFLLSLLSHSLWRVQQLLHLLFLFLFSSAVLPACSPPIMTTQRARYKERIAD